MIALHLWQKISRTRRQILLHYTCGTFFWMGSRRKHSISNPHTHHNVVSFIPHTLQGQRIHGYLFPLREQLEWLLDNLRRAREVPLFVAENALLTFHYARKGRKEPHFLKIRLRGHLLVGNNFYRWYFHLNLKFWMECLKSKSLDAVGRFLVAILVEIIVEYWVSVFEPFVGWLDVMGFISIYSSFCCTVASRSEPTWARSVNRDKASWKSVDVDKNGNWAMARFSTC